MHYLGNMPFPHLFILNLPLNVLMTVCTFYTFYPFITKFNVDERSMNQVSKNIHKSFSFKSDDYKVLTMETLSPL